MLPTTSLVLPLWGLVLSLLLSLLLGAGLVWRLAVVPVTTLRLPRLHNEHCQLYDALLELRYEAGHAVRAHYDEGLHRALRTADHAVFAIGHPRPRPYTDRHGHSPC